MGLPEESVRVFIGGDEYSIKADVDLETTKKVAEYVDKKIMEFQRKVSSRDKIKIAVLSALTIAGELFEIQKQFENAQKRLAEIEQTTQVITKKINDTLSPSA
jgi:cell division protein ZapA